jgi:hypothetical protein
MSGTNFSKLAIVTLIPLILSLGIIPFTSQAFAQSSGEEFNIETLFTPTTDALTEFWKAVVEWTGKILTVSILLIVGLIAGKITGGIVERSSRKILEKTTSGHESETTFPGSKPKESAKLIGATVRWFVYLFFILAAVNALEFEALTEGLTSLWLWIPNLIAFVIILVIGFVIANFVGKWLDKELKKQEYENSKILITVSKVIVYLTFFSIAITQLGVGKDIIPILVAAFSWSIAVGIGAAIAVGLGFALKDILPGAIISCSRKRSVLKEGQKIKLGDVTGKIISLESLHLVVERDNGEKIIIPSKELRDNRITILPSE